MDEPIDIWDAEGLPTGKSALKSEAHRNGWWHPTVHIWFYTVGGKVLLQRRSDSKETFPGLWDVSVAGHIAAGESAIHAALREIHEEIGLEVQAGQLESIAVHKESRKHPNGIIDSEFRHIFLSLLHVPPRALSPQASEVSELKLVPLPVLAEESWGLARPGIYVPHGADYYAMVCREIQKRVK